MELQGCCIYLNFFLLQFGNPYINNLTFANKEFLQAYVASLLDKACVTQIFFNMIIDFF